MQPGVKKLMSLEVSDDLIDKKIDPPIRWPAPPPTPSQVGAAGDLAASTAFLRRTWFPQISTTSSP